MKARLIFQGYKQSKTGLKINSYSDLEVNACAKLRVLSPLPPSRNAITFFKLFEVKVLSLETVTLSRFSSLV